MSVIVLPAMSAGQQESWNGLLDVAAQVPTGWVLVGGQMVHLWCAERGAAPLRPTDDIDAVLDVRAEPLMLKKFTDALVAAGFTSDGESWRGHQQRFVRAGGQIDLLLPRGLGERAASRRGATGGTTLETPGGQGALNHAEHMAVHVGERQGMVWRPSLAGALAAKSAAYLLTPDAAKVRHLTDFAVLTTLILPADRIGEALTKVERERVLRMSEALKSSLGAQAAVPGAREGLQRLLLALGA